MFFCQLNFCFTWVSTSRIQEVFIHVDVKTRAEYVDVDMAPEKQWDFVSSVNVLKDNRPSVCSNLLKLVDRLSGLVASPT